MTTRQPNTADTTATWSDTERASLDALLNELLPATEHMPAASALPVAEFLATRMGELPAVTSAVRDVLRVTADKVAAMGVASLRDVPAGERTDVVRQVQRDEPASFRTFLRYVHMGYYTQPSIPPKLGLPDRPPQPLGHKVPKDTPESLHALLSPVVARGKRYRDAG